MLTRLYDQLRVLWDGAMIKFEKVNIWFNNAGLGHAQ